MLNDSGDIDVTARPGAIYHLSYSGLRAPVTVYRTNTGVTHFVGLVSFFFLSRDPRDHVYNRLSSVILLATLEVPVECTLCSRVSVQEICA